MKHTSKRAFALVLVLVQVFTLLPVLSLRADAADPAAGTQTPALNEMIVGTVKFQSFNFLGDNATGEDGTDYQSTFYYTDDYFSPSAVNENANSRTMLWTDLENTALAACSFDFAVASYTSAEGDVVSASSQTWNNTDYSDKDKNVKQFLGDCGFTNVEPHALTVRPTNDSIGYTLGSKTITVWNADTQKNETYTLVAVGVRGAGYGAEWASNITIGDPETRSLPANGRHYGFDHSAQIVCEGIQDYLSANGITGNVKYWVTGFSRAAAVANLVAGYLTDGGDTYHTQKKDVFGYTYECPQAAKKADANFTNYKNIHNILNPMDAVPKVSPDDFEHQRLGVDYQMPYHGTPNLSATDHTALYNQMFEVLKTIAVGNGTDPDPLVDNKDTSTANDGYAGPNVYPYNSRMTIYKMSGWQLIQDAMKGTDTLMSNFGTVVANGNLDDSSKLLGRSDGGWYIDQFVDHLISVFLTSNAWIGGTGNNRTAMQNRTTFIQNYQNDFRNLLGYFLDFSGPAFLGLIPKLVDAIRPQLIDITNLGLGYAFYKFYNEPNGSFSSFNVLAGRFRGKPYKTALIYYAKSTAKEVANDMVSGFTDPQDIRQTTMNNAMDNMVELIINLYAYELDAYESQYLGTSLRYLWEILCTHEQEVVMSWIKSLDSMHMNRACRRLTVPAGTDVKIREFRSQYQEQLGFDAAAPVVAECRDGQFVARTDPNGKTVRTLDDRISVQQSGTNMIIRYPATLDLRFDVTAPAAVGDVPFGLEDYTTQQPTTALSDGEKQYDPARLTESNYRTLSASRSGAQTWNSFSDAATLPLEPGETLSITARATGTYDNSGSADQNFYAVRKSAVKVVNFAEATPVAASVAAKGTSSETGGTFGVQSGSLTFTPDLRASGYAVSAYSGVSSAEYSFAGSRSNYAGKVDVVPATSIYYNDSNAANADLHDHADTTTLAGATKDTFSFTFFGTGVDAYCTCDKTVGGVHAAVYAGTDTTGTPVKTKIMGNYYDDGTEAGGALYNVPTISFRDLSETAQTYTLVLTAKYGKDYKLDGVRVFNTAPGAAVAEKLAQVDEDGAEYVNVRDLLLGAAEAAALTDGTDKGAVFFIMGDDGASFEDYSNVGPKNEAYLTAAGQGIAFNVSEPGQTKVAVGLRAADQNSGTVKINGQPTPVTGIDTYVPVTPDGDGNVKLEYGGNGKIAVTCIKLTDRTDAAPAANEQPASGPANAPRIRASAKLLAFVNAPDPVVTEEPDVPEPTPEPSPEPSPDVPEPSPEPSPDPTPQPDQPADDDGAAGLWQSLLNSLRRAFGGLFSGLGGW